MLIIIHQAKDKENRKFLFSWKSLKEVKKKLSSQDTMCQVYWMQTQNFKWEFSVHVHHKIKWYFAHKMGKSRIHFLVRNSSPYGYEF